MSSRIIRAPLLAPSTRCPTTVCPYVATVVADLVSLEKAVQAGNREQKNASGRVLSTRVYVRPSRRSTMMHVFKNGLIERGVCR